MVCRIHRIKRVVPWRCRTGTLKILRNAYGVGSQTVGATSSVRLLIWVCHLIYNWKIVACDVELSWLFNVKINDISVIYVTAHRCAGGLKKKLDLRSGSQRHRHFVGIFNVPVQAPTRDHPFIRWFRHTAPISRLLRSRWGHGGDILDLTHRALTDVHVT